MRNISNYKELFANIEPEFAADSISISERKEPNMLMVFYALPRSRKFISFIILVAFSFLVFLIDADEMLIYTSIKLYLISVVLLILLTFIAARSVTTVFDGESGAIYIKKHGLFGTELNSSLEIVAVSKVKKVVMMRRRIQYRDYFEVLLDTNSSRRVPLTGKYLTFAECQILVKTIYRYLNKDHVRSVISKSSESPTL